MKINYTYLLIPFLLSCVDAQVIEPSTCIYSSLEVPIQDDGRLDSTQMTSIQLDESELINNMVSFGTVDLSIVKNQIFTPDNNFYYLNHIQVNISAVTDPIHYQSQVLVNQDVNTKDNFINLKSLVSDQDLLEYLNQGTIQLDFLFTGNLPTVPSDMVHTMCLSSSIHINKSL